MLLPPFFARAFVYIWIWYFGNTICITRPLLLSFFKRQHLKVGSSLLLVISLL